MGAAILAFLQAFPAFVTLAQSIWVVVLKMSNGDVPGYVSRVGEAFATLSKANTSEEHANAAKAIADAISTMPRGK